MSERLTLYALLAMGKIEPAWPRSDIPSDIARQSPGDIWWSDKEMEEDNTPFCCVVTGHGCVRPVQRKQRYLKQSQYSIADPGS